jgi:hypothetical protein
MHEPCPAPARPHRDARPEPWPAPARPSTRARTLGGGRARGSVRDGSRAQPNAPALRVALAAERARGIPRSRLGLPRGAARPSPAARACAAVQPPPCRPPPLPCRIRVRGSRVTTLLHPCSHAAPALAASLPPPVARLPSCRARTPRIGPLLIRQWQTSARVAPFARAPLAGVAATRPPTTPPPGCDSLSQRAHHPKPSVALVRLGMPAGQA